MTDEAFCYFHENGLDFDGNEAWINEGNGRMAKIWGESTVAHFARKVRATDTLRSLGR